MGGGDKKLTNTWHENEFERVSSGVGPDYVARGFPFCTIDGWNRLPADFFGDGFELSHLYSFKCRVKLFDDFLRRQPAAPNSPLGQPRNILYGHLIACLVGIGLNYVTETATGGGDGMPRWVTQALSPSLAIAGMALFGVTLRWR